MNKVNYYNFRIIEDESNLANELNQAMRLLNTVRIMASPHYFPENNQKSQMEFDDCSYLYCQLILFEDWCHHVVMKARNISRDCGKYLDEFNGSWEYYARSNRLDWMRSEGIESGNDHPANEELKPFTIVYDIYTSDVNFQFRDIVFDTKIDQLFIITKTIKDRSRMTSKDLIDKMFGLNKVKPLMIGEDGIREVTDIDNDMMRASQEVDGDDKVRLIENIVRTFEKVKKISANLNPFNDNKEEIKEIMSMCNNLLNCK